MWHPRFHFALPMWGESYIEAFLEGTLPCLLAPGNLGDFRWARDSLLKVYTRAADMARLERAPGWLRLKNLIETRIIPIDELLSVREANFARLTDCQRMAVLTADQADAGLFFLGPDFFLSNGTIDAAARRIVEGRAAVIIPGSRVIKDQVLGRFRDLDLARSGRPLSLSGRELVAIALEAMHPQSRAWFWDSPNFDRLPPYLHFAAGDQGYVSATYVGHPLVVRSRIKGQPIVNIWDQDWIAAACPDPGEIEVATDSDTMALFGLDDGERFSDYLVPNRASIEAVAYFAEWTFNALHRSFGRRLIRFKAKDDDIAAWQAAENKARGITDAIDALLAEDDATVMRKDPKRLLVRLRTRYRYADRRFFNPPYAADTGEIGNALAADLPRLLEVASPADRAALIALARSRGIGV